MRRLLATCLVLAAGACARELPGQDPPANGFYFPIGLATNTDDPAKPLVYVLSSNFDLRFNAGWVSVVDAGVAYDEAFGGDPNQAVVQQLKIPSLGGELALGDLPGGGHVLVSAHRGEPSVVVMEVDANGRLSCGKPEAKEGLNSEEARSDCDRRHLVPITRAAAAWRRHDDLPVDAVLDPYAVIVVTPVGSETPIVLVGSITSGAILAYELDTEALSTGVGPILVPRAVLDAGNNGVGTLTRHPDPDRTFIVGTSRVFSSDSRRSTLISIDLEHALDDEVQAARVELANAQAALSVAVTDDDKAKAADAVDKARAKTVSAKRTNEHLGVRAVGLSGNTGGQELVDLVFSPGGDFAFATDNNPDAVFILDSTLQAFEHIEDDGSVTQDTRPKLLLYETVPQPGQPSGLAYVPGPDGDVLVSTSFDDDALFISSIKGSELVLARRLDAVAAGPFNLEPVSLPNQGVQELFLTSFFNHGLAVVNLPFGNLSLTARIALLRNDDLGVASGHR